MLHSTFSGPLLTILAQEEPAKNTKIVPKVFPGFDNVIGLFGYGMAAGLAACAGFLMWGLVTVVRESGKVTGDAGPGWSKVFWSIVVAVVLGSVLAIISTVSGTTIF